MRDLRRFVSGPAYARRLTAAAQDAGAALETEAMVTGWAGDRARRGHLTPRPAPGRGRRGRARDRRAGTSPPRAADPRRPARRRLHHRAAAEPRPPAPPRRRQPGASSSAPSSVSWSAVLTLREAGCRTVLVSAPRSEPTRRSVRRAGFVISVPVLTRTRVVAVNGKAAASRSRSRTSTPAPPG